jgi:chromosome segregation ATPase
MVKHSPHPGAVKNKNGSRLGAVKNKNEPRLGAAKKVMQRVEQARASYARAEARVANLRERLTRAEEKLTRRAARLSAAEESLAALAAAPGLDASAPPEEANTVAAVVAQEDQADPATSGPVADTLTAPAVHETSSPDGVTTLADVDVATEPAATAQSASARPARSRRKPASQGES